MHFWPRQVSCSLLEHMIPIPIIITISIYIKILESCVCNALHIYEHKYIRTHPNTYNNNKYTSKAYVCDLYIVWCRAQAPLDIGHAVSTEWQLAASH